LEPFAIGAVIAGKYEITRVLGQGGMGVVVAARHRELGELVALKFLRGALTDKPESYARFAREARTATRIKNEHVARVFDVGTVDGVPFMVMEHLAGDDLARVIRRRGPLPVAEAVDLLLQACEAIADAHNLGIVHRDLKPANLFVTAGSDGTPFVKVLDFGISKSTGPGDLSVTASAAVVGSPLYMSPEQLASSRSVDARADVWALGVILYEMLTGKTPFAGESFATLAVAILRGTCTPASELRPDVPAALEEAIAGALARDPASRSASVAAFARRIAPSGSDAARASCQRIERIAARVTPSSEPAEGEADGATVEQVPPSSVARALEAPGEITQPPALGRSVDPPAPRRGLPRVATLALAAGAAGLVITTAVLGVQRLSESPSSSGATPFPAAGGQTDAVAVDGATDDPDAGADEVDAPSADDSGVQWLGTPITEDGFHLGDFAVAGSSSRKHPRGVVAALGYTATVGLEMGIWLLAIDLERGHAFARNPIGYSVEEDAVEIARTPRGVLVAHQRDSGLNLHWFTDGTVESNKRSLPRFAMKKDQDLRGLAVFDDRIVLATEGSTTTTVWILDEKGEVLTSYPCHGGLFRPGPADLVQMGDNVIVSNLLLKPPDLRPVCAGRLHGPPHWREVNLRGGTLFGGVGGVYFSRVDDAGTATTAALDENLQPTGPAPPATRGVDSLPCHGLTGTGSRRTEEVAGQLVVSMSACCGDEGGGLFVCRRPEHAP